MEELYWIANYSNNTKLEQFSSDGSERKYKDIDREKLFRFDMCRKRDDKVICSIYIKSGRQLIFRRRTLINIGSGKREIIFLVGWQQTFLTNSGPKNIVVINYIHPDGSISLDGSRNNLELLDFEQ